MKEGPREGPMRIVLQSMSRGKVRPQNHRASGRAIFARIRFLSALFPFLLTLRRPKRRTTVLRFPWQQRWTLDEINTSGSS
jgi:hypothetical protein